MHPTYAGILYNGQQTTILVVDDEELLRQFMARTLKLKGYRVITAADGLEALQICEVRHREIDLLLTDITMPRMTGVELTAKTSRTWPGIRTLMVSGYALQQMSRDACSNFLQKPFTSDELAGKVQQILCSA